MTIYIIVFTISTLLFYFASKVQNKIGNYVLIVLALIPPCFIAGVRDLDVGIDIYTYGFSVWNSAVSAGSWSQFYNTYGDMGIEVGYLFVNYIISRFTSDIHIYFAIHQLLLLICVVLTAKRLKKTYLLWYLPLFYFLYLYNSSLSMLRQSLAIMLCLYVSTFIFEKKWIPFYIGCVACYMLHHSAALMFLLYPIVYVINRFKKRKITLLIVIIISTLVLMAFYNSILSSLISSGIADAKFERYVGVEGNKTHKADLILLGFIIIFMISVVKNKYRRLPFFNYTVFFAIISLSLNLFGSLVEVAFRASYYVAIPISYLAVESIGSRLERKQYIYAITAIQLALYTYVALNYAASGTVPYKSLILQI